MNASGKPTESLIQDLIEIVLGKAEEYGEKLTVGRIDKARELLAKSDEDLRAARVLYEKSIYASSIFHLQQCVEKASKFCVYLFGYSSDKEFKIIGHNALRAFHIVLKDSDSQKVASIVGKLTDLEFESDPKRFKREIERKKLLREVATLDYKEIQILLNLGRQWESLMNNVLRFAASALGIRESIAQGMTDFFGLYVLSIITFPHSSMTRYPDRSKRMDYSQALGIVKAAPEIFLSLERYMKDFPELLSAIEEKVRKKSSRGQPNL